MNPKSIITAMAVILIASTALGGCSPQKPSNGSANQTDLVALVEKAEAVKKEASLKLTANRNGNQLTVKITLDNPTQKPITSVQSWLSYDPKKLEGVSVTTKESDFELMAPYGSEFDEETGVVMIGRSTATPLTQNNAVIATVVFNVVGSGTTAIDFYDYREDLKGHSSANTIVDNTPYNVLKKPQSPALVIEN